MDWKSLGSVYASLMLIRGAAREMMPPELYDAARNTFFHFFSNLQAETITLQIQEYEKESYNHIFDSVQCYLSSKCFTSSSKCLNLSKIRNSKHHTYTMVPEQTIEDIFDGIKFTWSFHSGLAEIVSSSSSKNGKNSCFKLSIENTCKEFVNSSYIPHTIKEAEIYEFKNRGKKLFTNSRSGDYWSQVCLFSHPSTFDTIAIDPVLKQEIQEDLKKFVNRSDFYNRVGKAWKRGYLLYGPPGTGKTSLIAAIANYLEYDVYDMELTSVKSNAQLKKLLISTPSKSVIVIEDVDCSVDLSNRVKKNNQEANEDRDESTNNGGSSGVSLSGVLNFVDGLWSPCAGERLIIFTTNHKEKLDPALLRSGRMDKHICLSYCNMESFKILARSYLKIEEHELMDEVKELLCSLEITPADVAECFMKYDEDPDMGMRIVVAEMKKRLKMNNQGNKTDQAKTDKRFSSCNKFLSKM
ncbi:AAA-ATPase At3g50940-like [Papaver somniferum]|uniref:AAA-ATPase At3g50940-like n=1 Tax=Papaver somniferum TaxID=3469 RepID=UPI000E6FA047|nr:AAA-ATPase At3g50940-like [Papaver somniferum]